MRPHQDQRDQWLTPGRSELRLGWQKWQTLLDLNTSAQDHHTCASGPEERLLCPGPGEGGGASLTRRVDYWVNRLYLYIMLVDKKITRISNPSKHLVMVGMCRRWRGSRLAAGYWYWVWDDKWQMITECFQLTFQTEVFPGGPWKCQKLD